MIVTIMCIWYIYLYCIIVLITQLSSLVAQMVKHLPTVRETQVQSLGWEDLLEKEMATHSTVFLPGKSHRRKSLVGYSPWARKESDTTEQLYFHFLS